MAIRSAESTSAISGNSIANTHRGININVADVGLFVGEVANGNIVSNNTITMPAVYAGVGSVAISVRSREDIIGQSTRRTAYVNAIRLGWVEAGQLIVGLDVELTEQARSANLPLVVNFATESSNHFLLYDYFTGRTVPAPAANIAPLVNAVTWIRQ